MQIDDFDTPPLEPYPYPVSVLLKCCAPLPPETELPAPRTWQILPEELEEFENANLQD